MTHLDAILAYLQHHFDGAAIDMAARPIVIDWPGSGRYELLFDAGNAVPAAQLGTALAGIGLAAVMKLKGPRTTTSVWFHPDNAGHLGCN